MELNQIRDVVEMMKSCHQVPTRWELKRLKFLVIACSLTKDVGYTDFDAKEQD